MTFFLFDGSALVKRYAPEPGAALVNHLFARTSRDRLMCLMLGAAEAAAALVRKPNQGAFPPGTFTAATGKLKAEVVDAADFFKFGSDNAIITRSIPLSDTHSINATDAIVLQTASETASRFRSNGNDLVLVVSDRRLLCAAQAKGLLTFDPETQTQAELDTLIGP